MTSEDRAARASARGVVAVVVTWNRRELLERCLAAVLGQTLRPTRVVIVDNASDDGTATVLNDRYAALPGVQIVRTKTNIGGAGGFALGLNLALGGPGRLHGSSTTTRCPAREPWRPWSVRGRHTSHGPGPPPSSSRVGRCGRTGVSIR